MSLADIPYDTLFAAVYTVIDDWYQQEGWQLVCSRPGVKPRFGDSEVLTLEVMRELEGETRERRWYARVTANWRALFPCLPERSVLHKRTKSLSRLLDHCRCAVRDRLRDPDDPRRLPRWHPGAGLRCESRRASRRQQCGAAVAPLWCRDRAVCRPRVVVLWLQAGAYGDDGHAA